MRVIYRASLVFLLKDIFSKMPITSAVILCNGKQNPYTRKASGHYVFSNLYPGKYDISITCRGYNDINLTVDLKENQTKEIILDLSYSQDNQEILNLTRFEFNCTRYKKPLSNIPLTLKLKNELKFLKVIEAVEPNTDKIKTNMELVTGLLGQKYIYEVKGKEYEFEFWSYDGENKCYILKDFAEEKIEPDGKIFAIWNVRTNEKGCIIMPVIPQFMKDNVLEFEIYNSEIKAKASYTFEGKIQSGSAFHIDLKFRKVSRKKS